LTGAQVEEIVQGVHALTRQVAGKLEHERDE
jgi:hypothetical protein